MGKKRAQLTIFMILGVVILFIFLVVIQLTTSTHTTQLKNEQQRVLSNAFTKEALRIYMDDCLRDELEQGLILIGKQGRIWSDQPGGKKFFEEGKTGITFSAERTGTYTVGRIFYGITRENYLQFPNAYPCNEESSPPSFCQYYFPNTSVGFGQLQLKPATIQEDLERFLANRTLDCVNTFLLNNVSRQAVLESSDVQLHLEMQDDGIAVNAAYPLHFRISRQEFFQESSFNFLYPSRFKLLLDAAITFPLQWDQKFIDFNYTEATVQQPSFTYASELDETCTPENQHSRCSRSLHSDIYNTLGLRLQNHTLTNGDTILTIFAPVNTVIQNQPYEFRIARQNRAPALNYVQRFPCPEANYDYLVIKDRDVTPAQTYLGVILPTGLSSFADAVRNYHDGGSVGGRANQRTTPEAALGAPDWTPSDNSGIVSLGKEGVLEVAFTDNLLTGSGDSRPDIWIFEMGPSVEGAHLQISSDGLQWSNVGDIGGSTSGIDLDPFITAGQTFRYVRITDHGRNGYSGNSGTPGVDIDAIAAISSISDVGDLGAVNIQLAALDPDEQPVYYEFNKEHLPAGVIDGNSFTLSHDAVNQITPGHYELTAAASDSYNQDWQTVRILIDRPLQATLSIVLPYLFQRGEQFQQYVERFPAQRFVISKEDPLFLHLNLPAASVAPTQTSVNLDYHSLQNSFSFTQVQPLYQQGQRSFCLQYPQSDDHSCTVDDYQDQIANFVTLPTPFHIADEGALHLQFSATSCGANPQERNLDAELITKDCLPHVNPQHPFAYPHQDIKISDGVITTEPINPFLATHTCCTLDFELKARGTQCFENPAADCDGKIADYTAVGENKGYVLEQKIDFCDGLRGNICGGTGLGQSRLWHDELRCGDSTISNTCNRVGTGCSNILSWGFVDSNRDGQNDGWCHGRMGCQSLCSAANNQEIVADAGSPVVGSGYTYNLNQRAKENSMSFDSDLKVHCGCFGTGDVNKLCDANFDGRFEGRCNMNGACS